MTLKRAPCAAEIFAFEPTIFMKRKVPNGKKLWKEVWVRSF